MATHSSTLAWKIPRMEEHGRRQSMGLQSQTRLSNFTSLNPILASQVVIVVKNPPVKVKGVRDMGSILRSGRFPGEEHGNPLQYSSLESPIDRGA